VLRSLRRLGLGVLAGVACAPAPTRPPAPGPTVAAATADAAAGSATCDAACWTARADAAEALGDGDVAASHRARAHALAPSPASLAAWIDPLVAAGAVRRAREALTAAAGDAALAAEVERRLAALPAPTTGRLAPPSPSPALRAAYAGGDAAALAAAAGVEPYHLSRAAERQLARGEPGAARRLWGAARRELHERGAALALVPVERWMTMTFAWRGEELALAKLYSGMDDAGGVQFGALELRAPRAGAEVRRLHFARPTHVLAFSDDGATLVRDEEGLLVAQDVATGAELRRFGAAGTRTQALAAVGSGDGLWVLAAAGETTTLWDAGGRRVAEYRLAGTTPTITRVYTGEGAYHENHLHDSPTWPVAVALTAGAGRVAVGGSDAKVRVFDRAGGGERTLAFAWPYVEHRHMGGNPDLNLPLALRFTPDGERLVAVYRHGELIVWDVRRGVAVRHHPGRCDPAAAGVWANRHVEPTRPPVAPTPEDAAACAFGVVGDVSPDAGTAVTGGGLAGFRVRAVASGAGLAHDVRADLPDGHLRLAADGTLALVDLYGAVAVRRPGQALERVAPASPSGPISPAISGDGRVLHFEAKYGEQRFAWDLVRRRRVDLGLVGDERALALTGDGARVAVRTADALELRALAGAPTLRLPAPPGTAVTVHSAGGHVLVDMSDTTGRKATLVDPAGAARSLTLPLADPAVALSRDGRRVLTAAYDRPLKVWDAASGRATHELDVGVRHAALSRDGSRVAWMWTPDREVPRVTVRARGLDDAEEPRELTLAGWPEHLEFSPDGAEVLALLESGRLTRWRPADGSTATIEETALILAQAVFHSEDGRTVFAPGYDHVQIRAADAALTRLATVYPLLTGGWMVVSAAGAVDGSEDAPDQAVTRASLGDETAVYPGRLVWPAVEVVGTMARVLAGERVQPPLPAPGGPTEVERAGR
jgi:WD40 repeat protein